MRYLRALPGRQIEHEDLHGLLASGSRSDIREGDPATVRAEEDRRGKDPEFPKPLGAADEILRDGEAPIATWGAEATQSVAVGADEEEALLRRREPRRCHERKLVVHFEHDAGPVRP